MVNISTCWVIVREEPSAPVTARMPISGPPIEEEAVSTVEKHKGSGAVSTLDKALVAVAVVGVVLVGLWALHAVVGMVLLALKIVILVVVVALVVRVVHAVRR